MADGFGDLNAIGDPKEGNRTMSGEYGGNDSRGPVDNVLPTGIVARGNDVSARDDFGRGVRKEMSVQRNMSKARESSRK